MVESMALQQFIQLLTETENYHRMFEIIREVAREGAPLVPEARLVEVLRRHIPADWFHQFDVDAWRVAVGQFFTVDVTMLNAVPPNNLAVVALVAHFEAFLENLRVERRYPWPKMTSDRKHRSNQNGNPSYSDLKVVYKDFGADMEGCAWSWDDLDELMERRHCIVHRRGVLDEAYIHKLRASPCLGGPKTSPSPGGDDWWHFSRLRAECGDVLWVADNELFFHLRQLHEVAMSLDTTCLGPSAEAARSFAPP